MQHDVADLTASALGQLIIAITQADSETEVFRCVARMLPNIIPAQRASFAQLDMANQQMAVMALHGVEGVIPLGATMPVQHTHTGQAAITGKAKLTHPLDPQSPWLDEAILAADGMQAILNCPLQVEDSCLGCLNLATDDQALYSPALLERFEQIGALVSTQLERLRLLERTQQRLERFRGFAEQLQLLNQLAAKLSGAVSESEVFAHVSASISHFMPVTRISYALPRFLEGELKAFEVRFFSGQACVDMREIPANRDSGLMRAWQANHTLHTADLRQSSLHEHRLLADAGLISAWAVPIHIHGQLCALLNLASPNSIAQGEELMDILNALGSLLGNTLERIQAQNQQAQILASQHDFLHLLINASPTLTLTLDQEGFITRVSDYGAMQLGYQSQELVGRHYLQLHPDTSQALANKNWQTLLKGQELRTEVPMLKADQSHIWARQRGRQVSMGENDSLRVLVCEDITELHELNARLQYQANHDSLTGLPNRHFFMELLHQWLSHNAQAQFALLFTDIDRLKWVNDNLSHQAGDELLRQSVARQQSQLPGEAIFARLGGDEFVILLPEATLQPASALAARLVQAFSLPFALQGRLIECGISIGISLAPQHGNSSNKLLRRADAAMYQAKAAGGQGFQVFGEDPALSDQA
ncbi:diguanylate cyclase domain-containing protein [Balneatrix alpica]|uniref:diguanylate cyclase domain-containing protein n=1 Tax=Balneatrix alpica TaxID=75684 RepID=UPI002739385E|nr:diguanylate cyclase [Balneatrix alpica]